MKQNKECRKFGSGKISLRRIVRNEGSVECRESVMIIVIIATGAQDHAAP